MFRLQNADWNDDSQSGDRLDIWLREMQLDKRLTDYQSRLGKRKRGRQKKKMER